MTTLEKLKAKCDTFKGEWPRIRTINGQKVLVIEFDDHQCVQNFFEAHLLGCDHMKGHSSKVIGSNLYVWKS